MIKAFLTLLLALNLSGCSEKTPDIVQPTPVVKTLNLEFCNSVIEKTVDGYTFTGITYEQFEKCRGIQQEAKYSKPTNNGSDGNFKVTIKTKEEQMKVIEDAQAEQYKNTEYMYDDEQKAQGIHGMDGSEDDDYWNIDVLEEVEEVVK
jgi:hypothetical protein